MGEPSQGRPPACLHKYARRPTISGNAIFVGCSATRPKRDKSPTHILIAGAEPASGRIGLTISSAWQGQAKPASRRYPTGSSPYLCAIPHTGRASQEKSAKRDVVASWPGLGIMNPFSICHFPNQADCHRLRRRGCGPRHSGQLNVAQVSIAVMGHSSVGHLARDGRGLTMREPNRRLVFQAHCEVAGVSVVPSCLGQDPS